MHAQFNCIAQPIELNCFFAQIWQYINCAILAGISVEEDEEEGEVAVALSLLVAVPLSLLVLDLHVCNTNFM